MESLHGTNSQEVIEFIKKRQRGWTPPNGERVALIVEGGSMRGVLSAGSLLALDILGYRDVFDGVFATSAGAVNAAYFLSGQGEEGIGVYFDEISNRRFVNPFRLWKILDVDYVYDEVVRHRRPLNEDAIRRGHPQFYVTTTNALTGVNCLLNLSALPGSIITGIKASSAIPVLYNRRVDFLGTLYVDGGVSGGPPLDWAINRSFRYVLYLSTRNGDYRPGGPSWVERLVFRSFIGFRSKELMRSFRCSFIEKAKWRRVALGEEAVPNVSIATVVPDDSENIVGRTTADRSKLFEGARRSALQMCKALGEDPTPIVKVFARLK